jgi:Ca2+-binding RTX toxin-like protein
MPRGPPARIIASVCTLLFLLASLIPLSKSWGDNVIEAACSISGDIIRTDGTNRADLMLGCNTPDIIYGKSGNDILQGRSGNDRLYGDSGDDNLQGGVGGD